MIVTTNSTTNVIGTTTIPCPGTCALRLPILIVSEGGALSPQLGDLEAIGHNGHCSLDLRRLYDASVDAVCAWAAEQAQPSCSACQALGRSCALPPVRR